MAWSLLQALSFAGCCVCVCVCMCVCVHAPDMGQPSLPWGRPCMYPLSGALSLPVDGVW
jgi:hypothetical protein